LGVGRGPRGTTQAHAAINLATPTASRFDPEPGLSVILSTSNTDLEGVEAGVLPPGVGLGLVCNGGQGMQRAVNDQSREQIWEVIGGGQEEGAIFIRTPEPIAQAARSESRVKIFISPNDTQAKYTEQRATNVPLRSTAYKTCLAASSKRDGNEWAWVVSAALAVASERPVSQKIWSGSKARLVM